MSKSKSSLPRGITLSSRGRYRVRVTFEGRQVQVSEHDLLTHARAALDKARGEIVTGKFVPPLVRRERLARQREEEAQRSVLFSEWFEQWLTDLERKGRSKGTLIAYRSCIEAHVLAEFGNRRLCDITIGDVDALMERLEVLPAKRGAKGGRNGVVDNVGRTLRALFNAAVAGGVGGLEKSPFSLALGSIKRQGFTDDEVASPGEVAALAEAMPEKYRLAVLLAAYCSLRIGEVLGLQRADLEDLGGAFPVLHVRRQLNSKAGELTDPKSDSKRSLSIPKSLVPVIRDHLDRFVASGRDAPVFTAPKGLGRASHKHLGSAWTIARAGVRPGFRFHDLRHTGLTLFAQQGATLAELLSRGGHSSVEVALRYQHATIKRDRALTEALDAQVVWAA